MNRPEQAIQREVFRHCRMRPARGASNGGYRRKVEAAILRGLGTVAGVPDVCAIKDGKAYFLEIKAEGGRLTEQQEQTLIDLRAAGASATHAHELDQCLRVLEGWGLLRGVANTTGATP